MNGTGNYAVCSLSDADPSPEFLEFCVYDGAHSSRDQEARKEARGVEEVLGVHSWNGEKGGVDTMCEKVYIGWGQEDGV